MVVIQEGAWNPTELFPSRWTRGETFLNKDRMVETRRILEARPLQREVGRIGCWNDAWLGRRKQTFRRGVNEEEEEEEQEGRHK